MNKSNKLIELVYLDLLADRGWTDMRGFNYDNIQSKRNNISPQEQNWVQGLWQNLQQMWKVL